MPAPHLIRIRDIPVNEAGLVTRCPGFREAVG
jgi:hypothetical protein